MAIFYDYIKGCGANTGKGVSSSETDVWTWIKWADKTSGTNNSFTPIDLNVNATPHIQVARTNNPDNHIDLGKIIVSGVVGTSNEIQNINAIQNVFTQMAFKDVVTIGEWLKLESTTTTINNNPVNECYLQYVDNNSVGATVKLTNNTVSISANGSGLNDNSIIHLYAKKAEVSDGLHVKNELRIGSQGEQTNNEPHLTKINAGEIGTSNKCEALYFNATSDRRAKENIIKAQFNALGLVRSLPIYTFDYKSNSSRSIGIIAQEAQDIYINDFSIVDNKEASGENGDYMTVKESKLTYILGKAVQELEAKVASLEAQINARSSL